MTDDEFVDEGSALSFPCSDPPAWMGGSLHATPNHETASHPERKPYLQRARRWWPYAAAASGIVAVAGVLLLGARRRTSARRRSYWRGRV